ncbi:hypothetical protein FACS189472_03780 [Alphaproteobacteria bacterium]|nr:hypothetical protein FACS189472_03780 [Alphaproteobacteria bacterium]
MANGISIQCFESSIVSGYTNQYKQQMCIDTKKVIASLAPSALLPVAWYACAIFDVEAELISARGATAWLLS